MQGSIERVRAVLRGDMPDRPPLYDDMAVDEFLVFTARLRGVSGAEAPRRAAEVIEATELGEFAEERIGSLSHGYRQRVGIAQAIVHRPRLVLLDEPISGLDPVQIVEMRRLVRNLRGDHTVVVSSHILPEISETCDRLLVLREGHIIATGTEQELSAKLAAVQRVTLTFRASSQDLKAKVREALESLAPVRTVEVSGSEPEDGSTTLDIAAAEDCRPELARLVVEAGGDLLELRRGARELESIFLELSGAADEDEVPS